MEGLRKGRIYGTIVVGLERRRVIDLLPDRTSATVADWLQRQPGTKVVARDRSTEYARAALLGVPKAVQVGDRWQLLSNIRDMLERWLARPCPAIHHLCPRLWHGAGDPPCRVRGRAGNLAR